jgi:hypothetical protein
MRAPDEVPTGVLQVRVPVATVWTSPDAPRDLDQPATLDLPDIVGWTATMDRQLRFDLQGRTLTQALLGEKVQLLEEQGDWLRVVCLEQPSTRDDRGYPGWLRRAHLGTSVPPTAQHASVVSRSTPLSSPGRSPVELSFGTGLSVVEVRTETAVALFPDGESGTVSLSDVALTQEQTPMYGPDDVLRLARQFIGLRYLWGGTSTWGLDCSGLVHLVHRAVGVVLPRDASDQAASELLEPVPLTSVEAGDLYFFARPGQRVHHVGLASRPFHGEPERWMLHARVRVPG